MKFINDEVALNGRTTKYTLLSQDSEKLAVVLPGAGYTAQAPLLYYSTSLFVQKGYDVLHVNYSYTQEELQALGAEGLSQDAKAVINHVSPSYQSMAFCAKSLGTLALTHIIHSYEPEFNIWLTPLLQREEVYHSLLDTPYKGFVVIGDQDPCFINDRFNNLHKINPLETLLVQGADHGLEIKGNPTESINILQDYMTKLDTFIS